ncbi:MAG: hypothetical protein JSV91_05210 [Phycisphaerales bacterium]|nr:MAG: hypothetical protein JSV91_05210 [Phycisphaerales bacterium]
MHLSPSAKPSPALTLALVLATIAGGAGPPAEEASSPSRERQARADLRLHNEPLTVEALGLSIRLPLTSRVQKDTAGGQTALTVVDAAEIPAWRLRIQEMTSDEANPTAAALAAAHLERLARVGAGGELISNDPIQCGNCAGQLCYLQQSGPTGQEVVLGYLFLPAGERNYLLLAILTTPDDFDEARALLEASFATITVRTVEARSREWRTLADNGRAFLKTLTPDRLKSAVGLSQCLRVYRPGQTTGEGDTEIGWSVVSTHAAVKEAVGADNPADPQYAEGPDQGLLVFIRGRLAVQAQRGIYQDFTIRYWTAWDQSEERWNVLATTRQGEATRSESEIGVRDAPASRARPQMLTVIQSSEAIRSREPYEWPVPEVYLSQGPGWLIGRLLPRDGSEGKTYAYYFYNNQGPQPELALRTDRWEPVADKPGQWRLTTRLGVDARPTVSIYNADGSLVRQTREDRTVIEPGDPEMLQRLWRSKGLDPGGAGR